MTQEKRQNEELILQIADMLKGLSMAEIKVILFHVRKEAENIPTISLQS